MEPCPGNLALEKCLGSQFISMIDYSVVHSAIAIWTTHYCDVIMGAMASQIISLLIVYSTVYSGSVQRKHQNSASMAFVWGIHRWPVNSPHKAVTRKIFPFDDVITFSCFLCKMIKHTAEECFFIIVKNIQESGSYSYATKCYQLNWWSWI